MGRVSTRASRSDRNPLLFFVVGCTKTIRRLLDVGANVLWVFFDSFFTAWRSNRRAKDSIVEEERDKLGKEVSFIEFLEPSLRMKEQIICIGGCSLVQLLSRVT